MGGGKASAPRDSGPKQPLKNALLVGLLDEPEQVRSEGRVLTGAAQQVTVIGNAFFLTRNAGDMHNLGTELELQAVPAKGLQAEWTVSLSKVEYARLTTVVTSRNQDLAGNQPSFNPVAASFVAL